MNEPYDSQPYGTPSHRPLDDTPDSQIPIGSYLSAKIQRVRSQECLERRLGVSLQYLKSTRPGLRKQIQSQYVKRLSRRLSLSNHDCFLNNRSGADHSLNCPNSSNDRLFDSEIMAFDFQCGRTGHRRDGLFKRSQYLLVRCPNCHRGQNTQRHSGSAEEDTKRPLQRMGANQGEREQEWYSHLWPGRMLQK